VKSEIIKLEEELRQAMLNNNVEKLDELIDDSLVFMIPDGNVATKQMDLLAHRDKIQKISELTASEQIIKFHENFAVVTVKVKLAGIYGKIDISGKYRYLRIWKKISNNWKIVAGSVTQIID